MRFFKQAAIILPLGRFKPHSDSIMENTAIQAVISSRGEVTQHDQA